MQSNKCDVHGPFTWYYCPKCEEIYYKQNGAKNVCPKCGSSEQLLVAMDLVHHVCLTKEAWEEMQKDNQIKWITFCGNFIKESFPQESSGTIKIKVDFSSGKVPCYAHVTFEFIQNE